MRFFLKNYINFSGVLLLLRLITGTVMFLHGSQKLLGWFGGSGYTATIEAFETNMGLPVFLSVLAIVAEFFGGLALIFGFLTRIAAFGVAVTMGVAFLVVHFPAGFFLPNGFEYALTLFVLSTAILLAGPGDYSIDSKIFNKTVTGIDE